MLNQVILVGKVSEEPLTITLENGEKEKEIELSIQRAYKNSDGGYDIDFVTLRLIESLAKATEKFIKKGAMIAIKGRVESKKGNKLIIIYVEKMTYLSPGKING